MNDNNIITPSPNAIVDSLRSIGYTLETAVADIIDNSITAGAHNIKISSIYGSYTDAKIFILDDGHGMKGETLREAMRLGTNGPEVQRDAKDLGRFGLGLKTASFSQCRRFSVLTKTIEGEQSAYCWDIDVIKFHKEWRILGLESIPKEFWDRFNGVSSGTLVVWEKMDRVLTDGIGQNQFFEKMSHLGTHLSLIFHRFLGTEHLKIWVNNLQLYPMNPFSFYERPNVGKLLPPTNINQITIRGHVMPHKDKLSNSEYQIGALGKSWTQMQGFYVYRGDRLIVAGGWMGLRINDNLIRQDRYHDLARIEVNIPNEVDMEWQLDVMKSRIIFPDQYIPALLKVANDTREAAYNAYMYRDPLNKKSPRHTENSQLWVDTDNGSGMITYEINTDFPILSAFEQTLNRTQKKQFSCILKYLAHNLPLDNIGMRVADGECLTDEPIKLDDEQFSWMEKQLIELLINKGKTKEEANAEIKKIISK